jgi:catechol 2,3-dioxygenase-like lactoylglutathione lyase family enzyme
MTSQPQAHANSRVLRELPMRLHHNAYVCADQERTRTFYEDIVGLPLVATWVEQGQSPDFPGREISFAHTFFAIGDGGALAFFQFADADVAAKFKAQQQPFYVHLALAVSEATSTRSSGASRPRTFPYANAITAIASRSTRPTPTD